MSEIKEIDEVNFGILSEEEILKMSVAEITKNRLTSSGKQKDSVFGSLYDPRMGPMESKYICSTCALKTKDCPGHFGHIVLNVKVVHPLFYRTVLNFLRCFCIQCSDMLVTEEHLELWNLKRLTKEHRFTQILEKVLKIRFCTKCSLLQPKYTLSTLDNTFIATYKTENVLSKVRLNTDEIYNIFSKVSKDNIRLLGFDPERMHPKSLILTILPVLPPRSRPFIVTDSIISDDDLTISYSEIIKANNKMKSESISEIKRQKFIDTLIFRIKTLFDNSAGKSKHTNSRPMKGVKERLCGKNGLVRENLLGKRTNFSARTVIGPDVTLRLNEIAVPNEICDILSFPENVNKWNIEYLQKLVWNGQVNMIDKKHDTDQSLTKIRRIHTKRALNSEMRDSWCTLEIGDVAHRRLQDGDIVYLNRQPSLHKTSMLAKRVIRRPGKTIRMNLATTGSFNADFDGDEMNIFVPQSETTKAELQILAATQHNMIGTQSSNSVITIVQDALLSSYLMTRNTEPIDKGSFFQLIMKCDSSLNVSGGFSYDHIQHKLDMADRVFKKFGKNHPLMCGKTLFSMLLPDDFNYTSQNKAMVDEPIVKIYKGILYEGAINKENLKGGHNSLICLFNKEYSADDATHFVNNVQFLANEYLLYHGFSIGIGDCVSDSRKSGKIDEIVAKCFMEAQGYEETVTNEFIKEAKINMTLGKAKDVGMRIAKESLKETNNFISTVTSGSKGDYFNITQIMGLLGQQNIGGKRVKPQIGGKRTLVHYPFNPEHMSKDDEFVSRGFVKNSFLKGLSPQEFWFHAASGREGITDTSLKTASSGYTQRKMVKIMEDIQIKYDQTVRNSMGSIIQFSYGNDNLCGTKTVFNKNKTPTVCNVNRLVDQLNTQYELQNSII
jgi:DNA-directed RNA polymerase II subunit RPB1